MVMGNNCWAKELCILNETDNMWYKFIEIILTTMEFKSAGTFPVIIRTYKAGKIQEFFHSKMIESQSFFGAQHCWDGFSRDHKIIVTSIVLTEWGVVHVAVDFYFSIVFWYDNIC